MATSMIDRYRKILDADPSSMVFVELAKALLDQDHLDEAISCCKGGMEHHPDSIVGHVLWGRALIDLGRPDEAMDQFEKAMALDPDNPYAYNLIGEALLHRRLYRSALPVLTRAASLQPGDRQIRSWLAQAERAVSENQGGEEHLTDPTADSTVADRPRALDPAEEESSPSRESRSSEATSIAIDPLKGVSGLDDDLAVDPSWDAFPEDTFSSDASPELEPAAASASESSIESLLHSALDAAESFELKTESTEQAGLFSDIAQDPEVTSPETPNPAWEGAEQSDHSAIEEGSTHSVPQEAWPGMPASEPEGGGEEENWLDMPASEPADASEQGAQAGLAESEQGSEPAAPDFAEDDVLSGMTGLFQSLEQSGALDELSLGTDRKVIADLSPEGVSSELSEAHAQAPYSEEATLPPAEEETSSAPEKDSKPDVLKLFGLELPPLPGEEGHEKEEDAPEDEEEEAEPEQDPGLAAAIAADYERELREELITPEERSFKLLIKRLTIGAGVTGGLVIVTAIVAFVWSTVTGREEAIQAGLDAARNGIARDTHAGYTAALDRLSEVLRRDDTNAAARAYTASTEAVLFSKLDPDPDRRARAETLLKDPELAELHPDVVLDARYHLADENERGEVAKDVLEALEVREDSATLHYLAGLHHLSEDDTEKATEHFSKALELQPGHARTVLALGNHFAALERWENALTYFDNVRNNYEAHGRAEVGAARARLALDRELDEALEAVLKLEREHEESLAKIEHMHLQIVASELQHRTGSTQTAIDRLQAAMTVYPEEAGLPALLARIQMDVNNLPAVIEAVEKAEQLGGENDTLRRLKAEAFMAWSRYEEAGAVLESLSTQDQRTRLQRAIADYHKGDYRAARQALEHTRNEEGQMLADAAIYLALVDLATEHPRRARAVLTRAAQARGADVLVSWALGRWHLEQNEERPTRHHLGNAVEQDPSYYRALVDLATLEVRSGAHSRALSHLATALEANPYFQEALQMLGKCHLALGEPESARDAFERVLRDDPSNQAAHRGLALAYMELGNLDSAETHARAAVEHGPREASGHHVLGLVSLAKGEAEQARQAFMQARRRSPDDPRILTDLAKAHLERGRPIDRRHAQRYLEEALEKDNDNAYAHWQLGLLQLEQEEIRESIQSLNRAEALATRGGAGERKLATIQLDLARAHMAGGGRGGLQRARQAAVNSVRTRDSAEGRTLLGEIYIEEKRPVLARQQLEQAVALDPDSAMAHFHLGKVLAEAGEGDLARQAIGRALELAPRGGHVREARRVLESIN